MHVWKLCLVFVSIGTCITIRLGVWPNVFFYECFAAMFIYYATHWQTYCSGTLHFAKFVHLCSCPAWFQACNIKSDPFLCSQAWLNNMI